MFFFLIFFFSPFPFFGCTSVIWKFLGQGLNHCRVFTPLLWVGDQTHASTVTQATVVGFLNPLCHSKNSWILDPATAGIPGSVRDVPKLYAGTMSQHLCNACPFGGGGAEPLLFGTSRWATGCTRQEVWTQTLYLRSLSRLILRGPRRAGAGTAPCPHCSDKDTKAQGDRVAVPCARSKL